MTEGLKDGMYIRTKWGIAKAIYIDDEIVYIDRCFESIDETKCYKTDIIGEPSFFIIDLIEPDDYVNGSKVLKTNCNFEYTDDDSDTGVNEVDDGLELENGFIYFEYEIESVVTKEQFESINYKVMEAEQNEFVNFLTESINKLRLKQKNSKSGILKANTDLQIEVYSMVLLKYKELEVDKKERK